MSENNANILVIELVIEFILSVKLLGNIDYAFLEETSRLMVIVGTAFKIDNYLRIAKIKYKNPFVEADVCVGSQNMMF